MFTIRRTKIEKFVKEYIKGKHCVDCGEIVEYAMQYNHVRGKKKYVLFESFKLATSMEDVQNEISKCDVVCANCHRIRTQDRIKINKKIVRDRVMIG